MKYYPVGSCVRLAVDECNFEALDYIEGMPEEVDAGGDRMGAIVEHTQTPTPRVPASEGGTSYTGVPETWADIVGGE